MLLTYYMMELVTAGGFGEAQKAESALHGEIQSLAANHEEADTHLVLHSQEAIQQQFNRMEVICRDTNVILLHIHFLGHADADMLSHAYHQPKAAKHCV